MRKKLLDKYKYNSELRKIRRRNVPKYILNKNKVRHIQKESKYRKLDNIRMNSKKAPEVIDEKVSKVQKTDIIS